MGTELSLAAAAASEAPASYQPSTFTDDSVAGSDIEQKRELLEIKNILKDLISPVRAGGGRRREQEISDGSDASNTL